MSGFAKPDGGYYLWCPLRDGIDDVELARQAFERGIFLAPGSVFCLDRERQAPALRIKVAYADNALFLDFLSKHCVQG